MTDATVARKKGAPIPVSVFKAQPGDLHALTAFECVAKANPQTDIASPFQHAIVTETAVALGDNVKKGQLLVRLDDRTLKADAENQTKELGYLSQTAQEQKSLADYYQANLAKGLVKEVDYRKAKIDWMKSQNDYQKVQEALAKTLVDLDRARVAAPRDGVVTEIINVGQVATSSDTLVSVAGIDPILAECSLADTDYALLGDNKAGQAVTLAFPAIAGRPFEGQIKQVQPTANYDQRMVSVAVELANPDHVLLPGMAASGQIRSDKNAIRIPAISLISAHNNESAVFVVEKETAKMRTIKTGIVSSGYVEVASGLNAGEQVVVAGQVELQENDAVSIIEPTTGSTEEVTVND
jgi:RND family efflux transporter MFP subunit